MASRSPLKPVSIPRGRLSPRPPMPRAAQLLTACAGLAALPLAALGQVQNYLMVVNGPAFTPTSDPRAIMLFDAQDGSLVNLSFIRGIGAQHDMDFPRDVVQVGDQIWVSDQTANIILRFDLLGSFLGSIIGDMANTRGMTVHDGVVYIASATASGSSPANAVVKRDFAGNYLGAFSAGTQPFDLLYYGGALLVVHSSGGTDITRWDLDGNFLGIFHDGPVASPLSIAPKASNGNVIVAGSASPAGIYEYNPAGEQVSYIAASGPRAAYELGNGNLLYSNSTGVHIYNITTQSSAGVTSRPGHFIGRLSFNAAATGACCLPSGSCQVLSIADCGAQSGIFRGEGTSCATAQCPQPGACCLPGGGGCIIAQPQACADQSGGPGVWYGAGSSCTASTCLSFLRSTSPTASFIAFDGSGVFLDLTAAADLQVRRIDYFPVSSNGAAATVEVYTRPGTYVGFTDSPSGWTLTQTLQVTSLGGVNNPTPLFLSAPIEVLQGQTVGVYVVGTAGGVRYRSGATTLSNSELSLFSNTVRSLPFSGTQTTPRGFAGAVYYSLAGTCYANCDGSTQPPILNVADFSCFLQKFAASDPYANCDESTQPPVLNVADFSCFLQKFAAGCR